MLLWDYFGVYKNANCALLRVAAEVCEFLNIKYIIKSSLNCKFLVLRHANLKCQAQLVEELQMLIKMRLKKSGKILHFSPEYLIFNKKLNKKLLESKKKEKMRSANKVAKKIICNATFY
jgi:hypothetical protein